MSEEIKTQILHAWSRYVQQQSRRYAKNEGSSQQHEDAYRLFKQGIKNHAKLSKKEKDELLVSITGQPA
ncbi:TPA: hypothetical protein HA225_04405 [Candidatus Micrarchaeota archaeon]|nr:hypothetical protein [Candidatus Micrarchaeota archaeon]HIH30504.1 hypothetical protein [Candidatus Micrarchaeota archaeon]